MILEIAQITIKPSTDEAFERGVTEAFPLFLRAKGCLGVELRKVVEIPNHYHLMVQWETIEHHTQDFRNSEDFQTWRRLVSTCFEKPPEVIHSSLALAPA